MELWVAGRPRLYICRSGMLAQKRLWGYHVKARSKITQKLGTQSRMDALPITKQLVPFRMWNSEWLVDPYYIFVDAEYLPKNDSLGYTQNKIQTLKLEHIVLLGWVKSSGWKSFVTTEVGLSLCLVMAQPVHLQRASSRGKRSFP